MLIENRLLYSGYNKKELEMNALEDRLVKAKPVTEIGRSGSVVDAANEPVSEKRGL